MCTWHGSPKDKITFHRVSQPSLILLANSNQWYFNNLVKKPCHKTPYRCPHRLNLSFQSSRSWALPNIKVLKDEDLGFANSIPPLNETRGNFHTLHFHVLHCFEPPMEVTNFRLTRDPMKSRMSFTHTNCPRPRTPLSRS